MALQLAREFLGMDVGYFTQFKGGEQTYRALAGDAASFGMAEDEGYPLDGTYCQRMVLGDIPSIVTDTSANKEVADLALTELGRIGAYAGVPIEFADGRLYGTLCTVSHEAKPDL